MKRITVTDLTRFSNRDLVCLAGIDEQGNCVRPLLHGTDKGYPSFQTVRDLGILPGSVLEGEFVRRTGAIAPHVEDHSYSGDLVVVDVASSDEFKGVLSDNAVDNFADGFGMPPTGKLFLSSNGIPNVSIMTLHVSNPGRVRVVVDNYGKLRMHVTDAAGTELSFLSVTDLGFADHLIALQITDPDLRKLNRDLQVEEELYLRLGLSREHTDPQTSRKGYWIQVNGIYSFPEYRTDLRRYD